ncbi:MAG: hypothetical protein KBC58_09800 [Flavobacterium sp.]|nr:hypothetical protein [Flavobacterium sp.]
MKKVLFLWMILMTISSQSQTDKVLKTNSGSQVAFGYLTKEQFEIFKDFVRRTSNIEVTEGNSFLINYVQPISDCFYNHYTQKCNVDWFEQNLYKKFSLPTDMIKLYYQHKKIDSNKCISKSDKEGYLYETFFDENKLCYGLIVINSEGQFRVFTGEYGKKDITNFINQLKIK